MTSPAPSMECPYPHCAGTLRTGPATGFCTLCRLPVSACTYCCAQNRAFAVVCRQCGHRGSLWREQDPVDPAAVDPAALRDDPRQTTIPQQVTTPPQAAAGFLWVMGEAGDLYRLNPYAPSGEQLEVHDRFWAEAQPHAFHVAQLRSPFNRAEAGEARPHEEDCAIVATADRVLVSGLFSRQRRALLPSDGERFLINSQDAYQFVVAHEHSVFVLSRYPGRISFCHFDLESRDTRKFVVAYGEAVICGPVLLTEGGQSVAVIWSPGELWVYAQDALTAVALPEAIALWTAPGEAGLSLPPGHSPAVAGSGEIFFAARQFGRPALLRLFHGPNGWSATVLAVTDGGTLGASTAGMPLLSTPGKLLACTGTAFRTMVQDNQIAPRFAAWAHGGLALFFCEADYRGLKQWLKAYMDSTEIPVSWNLPSGAEVQACAGFQIMGTALCCLCVLADRGLRTEFISWCC